MGIELTVHFVRQIGELPICVEVGNNQSKVFVFVATMDRPAFENSQLKCQLCLEVIHS